MMLVLFIISVVGTVSLAGANMCPEGFLWHQTTCFLRVDLNVSWIDAELYCSVLGGDLFSPITTNQEELEEFLVGIGGKYWLDITDLSTSDVLSRLVESGTLSYGHYDNNCVFLSSEQEYRWDTAPCSRNELRLLSQKTKRARQKETFHEATHSNHVPLHYKRTKRCTGHI